jgi:hypothetical protein
VHPLATIDHPLVSLFKSSAVNDFSLSTAMVAALTEEEILRLFMAQSRTAPFRAMDRGYFVGHSGKTTSGASTNRREEHLGIALWHAFRDSAFELPDGTKLYSVDYQVPLKARRDPANAGLGKVDLLCVDANDAAWVCELKIRSLRTTKVDTPFKACLQALAYCAILDPDMRLLSRESDDKKKALRHVVSPARPNLLILAPQDYWDMCHLQESQHPWMKPLKDLKERIEAALRIKVRFVSMRDCAWSMTPRGTSVLLKTPTFPWAMQSAQKAVAGIAAPAPEYRSCDDGDMPRVFDDWKDNVCVFLEDAAIRWKAKQPKDVANIRSENSEDVLTWQFFRTLEHENLITRWASDFLGIEDEFSLFYWQRPRDQGTIDPDIDECLASLEPIHRKSDRQHTETDLILRGRRTLVMTEVKLGSITRRISGWQQGSSPVMPTYEKPVRPLLARPDEWKESIHRFAQLLKNLMLGQCLRGKWSQLGAPLDLHLLAVANGATSETRSDGTDWRYEDEFREFCSKCSLDGEHLHYATWQQLRTWIERQDSTGLDFLRKRMNEHPLL